jgi:DNA-binding helix-hairpin-helix protein with protein kinase domain
MAAAQDFLRKTFYDIPTVPTVGKARLAHSVSTGWAFRMGVQFLLCRIAPTGALPKDHAVFPSCSKDSCVP